MWLNNCILHLVLWFCSTVAGIPWSGPLNTAKNLPARQVVVETDRHSVVQGPYPTQSASLVNVGDDPPEVCGYFYAKTDGTAGYRWACAPYSTCLWNTDLRAVGCCRDEANTSDCGFHTSCVESSNQQSCVGPCTSNPLVLRCTSSTAPYCGTAFFGPKFDYFSFACQTSSVYWIIEYSSVNSAYVTSIMTNVPRYIGAARNPTDPTTPTSAPTVPASQSSSSKPSSSPTPEPTAQTSSPNIGTIVGGAVGGFLGLCIAGFATTVFIVRKKRKATNQTANPLYPVSNAPEMQLYGAAYWNEMDGQGGRKVHEINSQEPRSELSNDSRVI